MEIVVIGGSTAGAFAALLLARAGHTVRILEQEQAPLPPDVETAAAAAYRTTAPHIVQPHIVMAKCRQLLLEYLPDVYHKLIAAGVAEAPIAGLMPSTLSNRAEYPGDDQLTLLMTRRSTVDWVTRQAILVQPGVILLSGVRVTGLNASPETAGRPPHVTGVRTNTGNIAADLVVDCSGGRSSIDRWLADVGAPAPSKWWAECGVAYFSRHFRIRSGAALPGPTTTRLVVAFDEFAAGIWGADNGTMQMAVVPLAKDNRFKTLKDPDVFTEVIRSLPAYASWLEALDPITGIFPMGAVQNTIRRLVSNGAPVATGLATLGDSVCTTNPTLGRGLTLALSGAVDLLDAVTRHPNSPLEQALVLDQHIADHVQPYYEDQARIDAARLGVLNHNIFGCPLPAEAAPVPGRVTYSELRIAAQFDPVAFRAFWKIMGMIAWPEDVYTDPDVVACTRAALQKHGGGPPVPQPSRERLLDALGVQQSVISQRN